MMNRITINRRELDRINEILNKLHGDASHASVELIQDGDNGIGTVLMAKFYLNYKDVPGEFSVVISDEKDW
jgi:hypothetical protein